MVAEGLATLLSLEGFRVQVAHAGGPVLELVAHLSPDVVLLDVTLPDISGIAVAHELRRLWHSLPIIMMTGLDVEQIVNEFAGDRKLYGLQKPFFMSELLVAIRSVQVE